MQTTRELDRAGTLASRRDAPQPSSHETFHDSHSRASSRRASFVNMTDSEDSQSPREGRQERLPRHGSTATVTGEQVQQPWDGYPRPMSLAPLPNQQQKKQEDYRHVKQLRLAQSHFALAVLWIELLVLVGWIDHITSAIVDNPGQTTSSSSSSSSSSAPLSSSSSSQNDPSSPDWLKALHYAVIAITGSSLAFAFVARCSTGKEEHWQIAVADFIFTLAYAGITIAVGAALAPQYSGQWPLDDKYCRSAHVVLFSAVALSAALFIASGIVQVVRIVRCWAEKSDSREQSQEEHKTLAQQIVSFVSFLSERRKKHKGRPAEEV